jgi:hypothetical protein
MSEKVAAFVDDDDDDDNFVEDYEDFGAEDNIEIKSLFDDELFDNVASLFKHEFEKNGFNLVAIVKKFQMNMFSYIKMINFIRKTVRNFIVFRFFFNFFLNFFLNFFIKETIC